MSLWVYWKPGGPLTLRRQSDHGPDWARVMSPRIARTWPAALGWSLSRASAIAPTSLWPVGPQAKAEPVAPPIAAARMTRRRPKPLRMFMIPPPGPGRLMAPIGRCADGFLESSRALL